VYPTTFNDKRDRRAAAQAICLSFMRVAVPADATSAVGPGGTVG
jgi:hypothetical protein